jgi:hypothetical protein
MPPSFLIAKRRIRRAHPIPAPRRRGTQWCNAVLPVVADKFEEGAMVALDRQDAGATRAPMAHSEEWFSILMALAGAIGGVAYFWMAPDLSPESHIAWAVPGWIAGAYLFTQMLLLLVSASQIRALGVLDSVIAILPVVVGLVIMIEWMLGHLPLSLFQLNALGLLIATSLAEFLLTIWIRFVINRRTIGFGTT